MLVAMDTQTGGMKVQLSSCLLSKGLDSISYCCLNDVIVIVFFCNIDIVEMCQGILVQKCFSGCCDHPEQSEKLQMNVSLFWMHTSQQKESFLGNIMPVSYYLSCKLKDKGSPVWIVMYWKAYFNDNLYLGNYYVIFCSVWAMSISVETKVL